MREAIDAKSYPWVEPSFATAEEAIAHARLVEERSLSPEMVACVGRSVDLVNWNNSSVTLLLDNGNFVELWCEGPNLHFSINDVPSLVRPIEQEMSDNIVLHISGREADWNRSDLLTNLCGKEFRRLICRDSYMLLYVRSAETLMFNSFLNTQTNRPFLYWEEVA